LRRLLGVKICHKLENGAAGKTGTPGVPCERGGNLPSTPRVGEVRDLQATTASCVSKARRDGRFVSYKWPGGVAAAATPSTLPDQSVLSEELWGACTPPLSSSRPSLSSFWTVRRARGWRALAGTGLDVSSPAFEALRYPLFYVSLATPRCVAWLARLVACCKRLPPARGTCRIHPCTALHRVPQLGRDHPSVCRCE
jgi:hypothetical protein